MKDRLAREKKYLSVYLHIGVHEESDSMRQLEFGAYVPSGQGQRGTSGRTNDFLEGGKGERALTEKQVTFQKYKWALRKIDGRYNNM